MSRRSEREQRDELAKDAHARGNASSDRRESSMLHAAGAQLNDDYQWKADEVRVFHDDREHRFKVKKQD